MSGLWGIEGAHRASLENCREDGIIPATPAVKRRALKFAQME